MEGRVEKEVRRLVMDAVSKANPGAFTDVAGPDSPILVEDSASRNGLLNGLSYAVTYLAQELDGLTPKT
jgi:hypothetical protein